MKKLKHVLTGFTALLVTSCTPAYAVDTLEVVHVTGPATCAVQGMPLPMPCAFAKAMIDKMMSMCSTGKCGGGCGAGSTTCPVKI